MNASSLEAKAENVGGEVGELALRERNCRHRVLRQHDMRHDRTGALAFFVCDFVKARNICIGLLLFGSANEMTVGTEARS